MSVRSRKREAVLCMIQQIVTNISTNVAQKMHETGENVVTLETRASNENGTYFKILLKKAICASRFTDRCI